MYMMPMADLTPFVNCSTNKDHHVTDAYQLTLKEKWANDKRPPKWTKRGQPSWA